MRRTSCLLGVVGFVGFSISGAARGAVNGSVETWDTDLAGWQTETTSTVLAHGAVGGNPDGHVLVRKDLGGAFDEIGVANNGFNADFLGDYGAAGVNEVTVDLNMFNSSVTDAMVRFRRDVSENGWTFRFGALAPNANLWSTFSTGVFDAEWSDAQATLAGWSAESGAPSFAEVMSDVGWSGVRFETSTGVSTLVGVDNFTLLPEPASAAVLGLGLGALALRRRA